MVLTILKNISQWEGLSHILWKIKNVPNHQPAIVIIWYLNSTTPIFNSRGFWCFMNPVLTLEKWEDWNRWKVFESWHHGISWTFYPKFRARPSTAAHIGCWWSAGTPDWGFIRSWLPAVIWKIPPSADQILKEFLHWFSSRIEGVFLWQRMNIPTVK